jgi:hypothetical protein
LRADCGFFSTPLQRLKTRVIKKCTNPEWDEQLTLSIEDPAVPISLVRIRSHPFCFTFLFLRIRRRKSVCVYSVNSQVVTLFMKTLINNNIRIIAVVLY